MTDAAVDQNVSVWAAKGKESTVRIHADITRAMPLQTGTHFH